MAKLQLGKRSAVDGNDWDKVQKLKIQTANIRDYFHVLDELGGMHTTQAEEILKQAERWTHRFLEEHPDHPEWKQAATSNLLKKQVSLLMARDMKAGKVVPEEHYDEVMRLWMSLSIAPVPIQRAMTKGDMPTDAAIWSSCVALGHTFVTPSMYLSTSAQKRIYGNTPAFQQAQTFIKSAFKNIKSVVVDSLSAQGLEYSTDVTSHFTATSVTHSISSVVDNSIKQHVKLIWGSKKENTSDESPLLTSSMESLESACSFYKDMVHSMSIDAQNSEEEGMSLS